MTKYKAGAVHRKPKPAPSLGDPGTYKVCFIDGHDLKYKTFTCTAENRKEAVSKMLDLFGRNFDHRIADVFRLEDGQ